MKAESGCGKACRNVPGRQIGCSFPQFSANGRYRESSDSDPGSRFAQCCLPKKPPPVWNNNRRGKILPILLVSGLISERWRKLVRSSHTLGNPTDRRYLEVCVFSHLAGDLRCGDVCIEGSGNFADLRKQLLPWGECQALLQDYCDRIGLASDAQGFVDDLKKLLTETAEQVDSEFPQHAGDVTISPSGEPTLTRVVAREIAPSAIALQAAIDSRLVPRNLLDILANIEHWTGFSRPFRASVRR